jgi:hypothetical protein
LRAKSEELPFFMIDSFASFNDEAAKNLCEAFFALTWFIHDGKVQRLKNG